MSHENIAITRTERADFYGWQVNFTPMTLAYRSLQPTGLKIDHFAELIVDGLSNEPSITVFQAALMLKQSRSWFNSGIGRELVALRDTLSKEIKEVLNENSNLEIFQVGNHYNVRVSTTH